MLQAALAGRYAIEREIGRGGMATVYLAVDLKHDRPVALKVLHPEIAVSVGPDRFVREIRLTAHLQHPHILPVFDSDAVAGRPWYTMPFVSGESLRDRLRREVQLPIDAALAIARQVALALEYAHRHGVVHRDIKPENVLLSDDQALVADFGVAKAVNSVEPEGLTGAGVAIGTVAYMAPEQAGGGKLDGRTDIYALGCLVYEMLAGELPFTGPTPQAMLAKRLAYPPPPLSTLRPTIPPAVDDAVRRAMAVVPADRFGTAAQFIRALDASVSGAVPASQAGAGRSRRVHLAALGLAALAALAGGYATLRALGVGSPRTLLSTGVLRPRDRILIADFQSRTPDSLIGAAVAEALRTDFAQSSVVSVVPAAQIAEALQRMRRPATNRLDAALAREVAIREGIKALVTGEVTSLGNHYLVSAQLVLPRSGEILAAEREIAQDAGGMVAAIDLLSQHLRERIGESLKTLRAEPPLAQTTTGSLEALWKYSQAIRVGDGQNDYARALPLLEEAVALDTGFATAYRTLGGIYYGELGERERGFEAFTKAMQHLDRLAPAERDHTAAIYYHLITAQLDKASAAYESALDRDPTDSISLNNLAIISLMMGHPAGAESLFRRLATLGGRTSPSSSGFMGARAHLGLARAQLELGRRDEAERTYQRTIDTYGNSPQTEDFGMLLAGATGDYPLAERRARTLLESRSDPHNRKLTIRQLAQLALVRGRLAEGERYLRQALAMSESEHNGTEYIEDAVLLGFLDIWFRRRPREGIRVMDQALARYPFDSIKPLDRPYPVTALAYAIGGRPDRARALLTTFERVVKPDLRRGDEFARRLAWGQVALAEGRFAEAIGEFQAFAAAPRVCLSCGLVALGQAYDRAGRPDSAIAAYTRYVTTPDLLRLWWALPLLSDGPQLAAAHKRLGELYEQQGDRQSAAAHYTRFVELWRECDPELRGAVTEVEQRLRRLGE